MAATLNALPREGSGKGTTRKLRQAGRIPANLYGHGDTNRSLSLDAHELEKLLHTISVENTVVSLSVEGGGTADVLIREVQSHPFKAEILHVDFIQLHAGETIRLQVPVRLAGTPAGVHEDGGVLDQVLHDLDVECLPRDIPEAAEIDVTSLRIGDQIRVRDVQIPNVRVINDEDLIVASVLAPTVASSDESGAGDAGSAEPELVRTKPGQE